MRFIIRKIVEADSLEDALKKEPKVKPDGAWVDEKSQFRELTPAIGFDFNGTADNDSDDE